MPHLDTNSLLYVLPFSRERLVDHYGRAISYTDVPTQSMPRWDLVVSRSANTELGPLLKQAVQDVQRSVVGRGQLLDLQGVGPLIPKEL